MMKELYSERQEEPEGVRGGGKYWMWDEKRERIWGKNPGEDVRKQSSPDCQSKAGELAGEEHSCP